jgi:hypothetical protein
MGRTYLATKRSINDSGEFPPGSAVWIMTRSNGMLANR